MRPVVRVITASVLLGLTSAIWVAPNSPCSVQCGNVLDATTPADMSCATASYGSTSSGQVFESCVDCQLTSNYTYQNQSDLQWMLYNIRYAFSYCLFGDPGNANVGDSPCITTTACGPLKPAIEWQNLTASGSPYDYCADWIEVFVPKCSACLTAADDYFTDNYLTILDAACAQRPSPGQLLNVDGQPFSTVPMNITTPTPTPLYTYPVDHSRFTLGAKVGMGIGALIFLLLVAGCCIVCNGRRRRRNFLRTLEKKHQTQGWPHPSTRHGNNNNNNGPEMFETPVSQKPLTGGWQDSPISAAGDSPEKPFPSRYFSPYSSQYNSPVSATEGSTTQQWPSLAQQQFAAQVQDAPFPTAAHEKMQQQQRQQQQQQFEAQHLNVPIGLALGGDEASLRSKGSMPQMQDSKGKDVDEAYEMHEVESSHSGSSQGGRYQGQQHSAPVLQPALPGRNSPPRRQGSRGAWYGGLTEEDAVSGRAI